MELGRDKTMRANSRSAPSASGETIVNLIEVSRIPCENKSLTFVSSAWLINALVVSESGIFRCPVTPMRMVGGAFELVLGTKGVTARLYQIAGRVAGGSQDEFWHSIDKLQAQFKILSTLPSRET